MEELAVGVFFLQEISNVIYLREEKWTVWDKLSCTISVIILKNYSSETINMPCTCTDVRRECTRLPNNRDIFHCRSWQLQGPLWWSTINHSFFRRRHIPYSAELHMPFQVPCLAYIINPESCTVPDICSLNIYFFFAWDRHKFGRML